MATILHTTSLTTSRSTSHRALHHALHRTLACLAASFVAATALPAHAQGMTEAQARAAIAPLYATFSQPVQGDVQSLLEQGTTPDWQSCTGDSAGECRGRAASVKVFEGFGKALPDMKHVIKEVLVSGDRVLVRGEITGTPAGDFFGVAHTGRSFKIMTLDLQTIREGKIAKTYHLEDWAAALGQLRAK